MKKETKEQKTIFEALEALGRSNEYPFHMPGHKRNMPGHTLSQAYLMDITEIEGFDNLHEPQGIIRDAMNRAKRLYQTKETFFLVNGSTVGILAAIHACVKQGEKILVARNCHKSVYNAIALLHLKTTYLYPEKVPYWNLAKAVLAGEVQAALDENSDIRAVVITSPTYDGFVSPIEEIAGIVHTFGIPLIVDEAHGAHFPFSDQFPQSALEAGADLVIHSLHKTMPAFTQTALLHLQGNLVESDVVARYLSMFQSTSPSYLFLGSIDDCIGLVEREGSSLWTGIIEQVYRFHLKMKDLQYIRVWSADRAFQDGVDVFGHKKHSILKDPLKIIIAIDKGMKDGHRYTGSMLFYELLNQYHLQMEMAAEDYVLGILTCMDEKEGLNRLGEALKEIDRSLVMAIKSASYREHRGRPLALETIGAALEKEGELIPLKEAGGRESACFVNLYPPGIPFIVPGEVIDDDLVAKLIEYREQNLPLQGLREERIMVVKEKAIF